MEPGTQPEARCPALSGPHRLQRRRLRDDGRPHAADPIRFGEANAKADFLCNQNQSTGTFCLEDCSHCRGVNLHRLVEADFFCGHRPKTLFTLFVVPSLFSSVPH